MTENVTSLYIHFPYCGNCCGYCDFYKVKFESSNSLGAFHLQLRDQWKIGEQLMQENGFSWAPLKTLYIGGGSPSLWNPRGVVEVLGSLDFAQKYEFTLEVNPAQINQTSLQEWKRIGVNRISMGVQSLNDSILATLGRTHSSKEAIDTIKMFKKEEISFSVDFLIGVPGVRDIISELGEVLLLGPKHLSLYILTLNKENSLYELLPSDEQIEQEYLAASSFLIENGFDHYEVSNFAKPGLESQHNLVYWKSESVAALGPSATGLLSPSLRYKWNEQGSEFQLERLSSSEINLESIYMRLRTNLGMKLEDYGVSMQVSKKLRKKWELMGYLLNTNDTLRLNSKGYLMLDSLMDDLFLYEESL